MDTFEHSFNFYGIPCVFYNGKYYLFNFSTLKVASFDSLDELREQESSGILKENGIIDKACGNCYAQDELHLTLILTTDCNLKCDYCYTESKIQKLYLSPKRVADIIDSFFKEKYYKRTFIQFFGGEPTLNIPAIRTVLNRVRYYSDNPFFYITTNGTFDEKVLNFIIKERIALYFSLDGLEGYNDLHRKTLSGEGSFSLATKNLRAILEAHLPCKVRSTITPDNVFGMKRFAEEMFRMGVRLIHFTPMANVGHARENNCISVDDGFYDTYVNNLIEVLDVAEGCGAQLVTPLSLLLGRPSRPYCKVFNNKTKFIITPEGKVTLCYGIQSSSNSFSENFILGEYNSQTRRFDISDKILQKLNSAYDTIVQNHCSDCFAYFACKGGCFAQNLSSCGSLFEMDKSFCLIQKKIVHALLIQMLK